MPADRPAVPLHDWTRVSAGKWHDMHLAWIGALRTELNEGVLPDPYFALAEPVTGFRITSDGDEGSTYLPEEWRREPDMLAAVGRSAAGDRAGGNGVLHLPRPVACLEAAEAPSRFALFEEVGPGTARRRVTVRHPDGDRVVALIEFASPGNRDAVLKVSHFAHTVAAALEAGIHCVLIDPFPPTAAAPAGLHGAVLAELEGRHVPDPAKPLTFVGYQATGRVGEYAAAVEPRAVGEPVPTVPLFLDPEWFLPLDLAPSYAAAFRGCPKPVREVLGAETGTA